LAMTIMVPGIFTSPFNQVKDAVLHRPSTTSKQHEPALNSSTFFINLRDVSDFANTVTEKTSAADRSGFSGGISSCMDGTLDPSEESEDSSVKLLCIPPTMMPAMKWYIMWISPPTTLAMTQKMKI
jgi:hypothetical protein